MSTPVGFASLDILGQNGTTGGIGGIVVTVSTESELKAAVVGNSPKIVKVSGTITGSGQADVGDNTTLLGLGSTAFIDGWKIEGNLVKNIIIQNIKFRNDTAGVDMVAFAETHHLWVDHCTFIGPGGDGALDITQQSSYFTVSWNHFMACDKTMNTGRVGFESPGDGRGTRHHNWYDGCRQRQPLIQEFGFEHSFNNFFDGDPAFRSRAIDVAEAAQAYVESNYISKWATLWTRVRVPAEGKIRDGGDNFLAVDSGPVNENDPSNVFVPSTFYDYNPDPGSAINIIVPAGAGVGKISEENMGILTDTEKDKLRNFLERKANEAGVPITWSKAAANDSATAANDLLGGDVNITRTEVPAGPGVGLPALMSARINAASQPHGVIFTGAEKKNLVTKVFELKFLRDR